MKTATNFPAINSLSTLLSIITKYIYDLYYAFKLRLFVSAFSEKLENHDAHEVDHHSSYLTKMKLVFLSKKSLHDSLYRLAPPKKDFLCPQISIMAILANALQILKK